MSPSSIAITPVTITDRSCLAITGCPWRSVRAWCRAHGVAIRHVGRRPTVVVGEYLRALAGETDLPPYDEDEIIAHATGGAR